MAGRTPAKASRILIKTRLKTQRIDQQRVLDFLEVLLGELWPGKACELSVLLVSRRRMAALNEAWMGVGGPTDQLSFPLDEAPGEDGRVLLGDLVLCPEVIAGQCRTQAPGGRPFTGTPEAELALVLIHGLLHLAGHDHHRPKAEKAMVALENLYFERHGKLLEGAWA
jgi:probable rRNA maturation factor